ncbi:hypothetical protein [Legionella sp.]|uniref:hypothetical protein n=1 Tax=Legionella sp. TaxID=459 RepID=UPI003CC65ABA
MITYFLATVLGWYLVIMGIFLISRREIVISVMNDMVTRPGILLALAFITLIFGLLMVVSHNLWVMGWPVIITIISWLVLINGIIRLFYPAFVYQIWDELAAKPALFTITGIIALLIGLFLLVEVYFI